MNDQINLKVTARKITGKANKKLRKEGKLPANVFGGGLASEKIVLPEKKFVKAYDQVGDTGIIYLQVDDEKKTPVMVEEVQYSPVKNQLLHVSLNRVNLKKKTTAEVPVELVGESDVPQAVVVLAQDSIEVEALPTDIPDKFEIDVSKLTQIGQGVTFAQLDYDRDKVMILVDEGRLDQPVVLLQEVKEEVVEEEPQEVEAPEDEAKQAKTEVEKSAKESTESK